MEASRLTAPTLLLVVLLLYGVRESGAAGVSCYKCSYYTHGDTTLTEDCIEEPDCAFCQTRVYREGSTELVKRDCVARCLSSGVPIIFKDIKDVSADEMCCTSDLCNVHPSAGAPRSRGLTVLLLMATLLLYIIM